MQFGKKVRVGARARRILPCLGLQAVHVVDVVLVQLLLVPADVAEVRNSEDTICVQWCADFL